MATINLSTYHLRVASVRERRLFCSVITASFSPEREKMISILQRRWRAAGGDRWLLANIVCMCNGSRTAFLIICKFWSSAYNLQLPFLLPMKCSDPGTCFVCDQCPGDERTRDDGMDCQGRPNNEGSAACVETTAYTLLALLEAEDEEDTVCLAQWLVRIRSGHGGFWSSQVSEESVYSW